ncbi:MAG: hypothetical protein JXA49_02260, partial [Actinobacteria bacterium]|nr:hypothetical protein [Actinomycetota bacterium]
PEGPVQRPPLTLSPGSRSTVSVGGDLPGQDVSTLLVSDGEILAERAMYWNERVDGHASEGVAEPRKEWFLAEGTTGYGFDTWVLVQNASSEPTVVNVVYYTPDGPIEKEPFTIQGKSRASVHANQDVPGKDVSIGVKATRPVVVERSMYWDDMRGGHNSCATPDPASKWYLAEGSTMYGFDEWVTIGNPSSKNASVELDYITTGGIDSTIEVSVPAQSRRTVHVNEDIQVGEISVVVESSQPVVVERSMYWNNGTGRAGHGALGATHPSLTHFLAEGCTANGFDQWVLIENPSKKDTTSVVLTYMTPNGLVSGPTISIKPMCRQSVNVNLDVPMSDVSVKIEATSPVIVERAMYWAGKGGGHNAMAVGVD